MKFSLKATDPKKLEADLLLCFVWDETSDKHFFFTKELDLIVRDAIKKESFEGKINNYLSLTPKGFISSYKLLVTGMGKKEEFSPYILRKAVAGAVRKAKEIKPKKVGVVLPEYWLKTLDTKDCIQDIVEAVMLSSYRFLKYKDEEERKKYSDFDELIIIVPPNRIERASEGLEKGVIYSEATYFARDLVNEPAAVTTPSFLAECAQNIAKDAKGKIKIQILDTAEIAKENMNAILGVAKGSDEPPKFIRLDYKPYGAKKHVVIIGKGITFDTGGLSLKPGEHMEKMKIDMAGAAAVLAVFKTLPKLNSKVSVTGIIPACENMPSGRALRPGDILEAANGKTIEVLNTDAEGRLTLADAISYVKKKDKPDYLIDLATLTGACMVALGEDIAGLWSNDEGFARILTDLSQKTGDNVWMMPLFKDYSDLIKSDIADLKNVQAGRYGGAITAALFLSEFVGNLVWAHLDIAGPAYESKDNPLIPKGGSGFGVRLLLRFLDDIK